LIQLKRSPDSKLFFHLETWEQNPTDKSTTLYLSRVCEFQKFVTTAAYKIASGVTDSSGTKQKQIPLVFSNKVTKAFLDSLYSFLDGLVHLASDDSPVTHGLLLQASVEEATGAAPLFDLRKNVSTRMCKADSTGDADW
jgi:exocyst complex component 2